MTGVGEKTLISVDFRYSVLRLKLLAEQQLCAAIDESNVCYRLQLAHTFSTDTLRHCALAFLERNKSTILESDVCVHLLHLC